MKPNASSVKFPGGATPVFDGADGQVRFSDLFGSGNDTLRYSISMSPSTMLPAKVYPSLMAMLNTPGATSP